MDRQAREQRVQSWLTTSTLYSKDQSMTAVTVEKASLESIEPYTRLRNKLSVNEATPLPTISLWSILKHNVGRDLTRVALPVYVNEPISMLQRMAEDLTFAVLLDRALDLEQDAEQRMAYVAAFACSNYATTLGRTCKPFNPVLGETFEFIQPGKHGFRFVAEQVSHHPPVSAFHAESLSTNESGKPVWEWQGCALVKTSFLGNRVDIHPTGTLTVTLRFDEKEEQYTYAKVTTTISGLMIGKLSMEHHGTMNVECTQTNLACTLEFERPTRSWTSKATASNVVTGTISSASGQTDVCSLRGEWSSQLTMLKQGKKYVLWQHEPESVDTRFNLTPFTVQLNDLPAALREELPLTDSRFRPDMRLLEYGEFDKASQAKLDVEQQQRKLVKERQSGQRKAFVAAFFEQSHAHAREAVEQTWTPKRTVEGQVAYWHRLRQVTGGGCVDASCEQQNEEAFFPLYAYK